MSFSVLDTKDCKVETNTNYNQFEGPENLFNQDPSKKFKTTEFSNKLWVKLITPEPIEFFGYNLILANDGQECDLTQWRVVYKQHPSQNICEETHRMASGQMRNSTHQFKLRSPKKTCQIWFYFEQINGGNHLQLGGLQILQLASAIGSSKHSDLQSNFKLTNMDRSKSADSNEKNYDVNIRMHDISSIYRDGKTDRISSNDRAELYKDFRAFGGSKMSSMNRDSAITTMRDEFRKFETKSKYSGGDFSQTPDVNVKTELSKYDLYKDF